MNLRSASGLSLAAAVLLCFLLLEVPVQARPDTLGLEMEVGLGDDPSRPCLHYEGDGCSIPFGLPFFYKTQFTKSCDRHDVCYHCGSAYNFTRPQCDHAFRQNTLATCKDQYLNATASPSLDVLLGVPDNTATARESPHQIRFLKTVEEHGMDSLEIVFDREVVALEMDHPAPNLTQFVEWFSRHDVHVRMLSEWVRDLSRYQQQPGSSDMSREESSDKIGTSEENNNDFDWCAEVDDYLKAHNESIPSSVGLVCPDIKYLTCNFFSEVYFLAVRIFANSSYFKKAEFYCHESWVPKCLPHPPSETLKFIPLREWRLNTLP
ncbi:conodipine-M alpha chain [Elysia marginata]|uniref:Conodipine-M alpha chain n=1 Tax=Elysia marginata TaxID=1093978 RepID=A0AAV4JPG0_9GAST|nr:conodipine-M alpha chain [Elysia marginata]